MDFTSALKFILQNINRRNCLNIPLNFIIDNEIYLIWIKEILLSNINDEQSLLIKPNSRTETILKTKANLKLLSSFLTKHKDNMVSIDHLPAFSRSAIGCSTYMFANVPICFELLADKYDINCDYIAINVEDQKIETNFFINKK